MHDPEVQILVATDAAGEGINLQQAHLMVNYDLPRGIQTASNNGSDVFTASDKRRCAISGTSSLQEPARVKCLSPCFINLNNNATHLGGAVFDVLGKCFTDMSLRNLLIEAIREGDKPEVKERLTRVIDEMIDQEHLRKLIEENSLAHGVIDTTRLGDIREAMERAEAHRLQPHFHSRFLPESVYKTRWETTEA